MARNNIYIDSLGGVFSWSLTTIDVKVGGVDIDSTL